MKDFMERILELVLEDQELHDAVVRLITATAEEKELKNIERKARKKDV